MRYLQVLFLLMIFTSCSTEKISVSPISENLNSSGGNSINFRNFPGQYDDNTKKDFYSAELSNQLSTFPKFENSALNQEVSHLKFNVKEYVYAIQAYNLVGQENSLFKIEKSYKKIQRLRKYLNTTDDEVINRYLVRIKSNISQLEALKKDSVK